MRTLTYAQAISEATVQCMTDDPHIVVLGEGVDDHNGVFGTTKQAYSQFGSQRVIDVPNSENACAGVAIGAARNGLRPMVVHTRADFLFLAMDAMVNLAAKWRYMFGDHGGVPVVTRAVVGRGWGQGATHSQSPHATFAHYPGHAVVAPASPADAKGLLVQALRSGDPTILIENRGLYPSEGEVDLALSPVPFGIGRIVRSGNDITIVAVSLMVPEAEVAARHLAQQGISVEVVDVRCLRPLDDAIICESVAKTRRLVVADTSWARYGFAAEVAAVVAENIPDMLLGPVRRVTPPDCPAPVSWPLEEAWNVGADAIARTCLEVLHRDSSALPGSGRPPLDFDKPY